MPTTWVWWEPSILTLQVYNERCHVYNERCQHARLLMRTRHYFSATFDPTAAHYDHPTRPTYTCALRVLFLGPRRVVCLFIQGTTMLNIIHSYSSLLFVNI